MRYLIGLGISLLILTGCTRSGYSKFYNPITTQEQIKDLTEKKVFIPLTSNEEPQVYQSNNMLEDDIKVSSNGYALVGYSSFNGQFEDIDNAKQQAKNLGAQIVLIKSNYTNTEHISGSLVLPDNKTTYNSGNINMNSNYGSNTYGNYYGTSTTYGTKVVPYSANIRRYDQLAQYYIKVDTTNSMRFGTFRSSEITREERIKIGSNGIKINYILNNSPVYKSNLLIGDVIVEFDGHKIENYQQFNDLTQSLLKNYSGTKVVKIYRNGEFKDIEVKF